MAQTVQRCFLHFECTIIRNEGLTDEAEPYVIERHMTSTIPAEVRLNVDDPEADDIRVSDTPVPLVWRLATDAERVLIGWDDTNWHHVAYDAYTRVLITQEDLEAILGIPLTDLEAEALTEGW
jgi:hypothetical protein